jgi:hypothetical protein
MIWAHARDSRIVFIFPRSTEHAVRTAGQVLRLDTVEVPDGTLPGATLVEGAWTNPEAPELGPQPTPTRLIPSTQFRGRFSAMEEAAVLTLAKTDPVVAVFYQRLLDPRQLNVELNDPQVQQGLGYLATLDDPLSTATPRAKVLTAARIAELLA